MLFNTPEYIIFFIVIFIAIYFTNKKGNPTLRNIILLEASYFFYAHLHFWFIYLLIYMTGVNYVCGLIIEKEKRNGGTGKFAVTISIVLSLACLIFYKYAYMIKPSILLPIGLSFFTFQSLTYTIDIYRGKIEPEKNLLNVALFISFFPTLLSGPIERARNILPQIRNITNISWDRVISGAGLFVWGLFKKVVVADRLAEYVNFIYMSPDNNSGSSLAIAAIFYSFQIYCDFSGYADMAIASGRIMGFDIMHNFNFPYCVNTIKEFWRRWHISLTSWFTEYVYISLGGNRVTQIRWVCNITIVFLLSGIWHGATISFLIWGAIHAVLYLLEHYFGPKHPNILYHLLVFIMVTIAWIFFRIENFDTALYIVSRIFSDLFSPISMGSSAFSTILTIILLISFVIREYLLYRNKLPQKYAIEYIFLILMICLFGTTGDQFVYFQF